jgi:hypothetical protein
VQTVRLDVDAARRVVLFRRRLDLDQVPAAVPARVTADSRYVLLVNGDEVARGPVRSDPLLLRYDEVDLAPHLRPGPNVLAAVGRFYATATPWWRPAPPTWGLGGGCFLFEAEVGSERVVSDATWTAQVAQAWAAHDDSILSALPVEVVDGRALPEGWTGSDFDDGDWPAATELAANHVGFGGSHHPPSHPFGPLLPRPIALLTSDPRRPAFYSLWSGQGGPPDDDPVRQVELDDHEVAPAQLDLTPDALPLEVAVPDGGVAVVHVDFGEMVAGTVVLDIDAPAGTAVDALFAERLDGDGSLRRDEQHAGFRYVTRGGPDRFETFDTVGFRYAGLSIRADRPVSLLGLSVTERIHPRPDGPFFRCSDPLLDEVWQAGRRTVDLCSLDAYVDCPTREQRAWTGDAVVHQMVDLASNPDWRLARWHVEMTAGSARPDGMLPMAVAGDVEAADFTVLPDWALHWVRSLHNLWRYTGDRDLVLALLPTAERIVRWFLPFRDERGLLTDVTGWLLVDWSAVTTSGTSSAVNALWARALRDLEEMSSWVGDGARAGWAHEQWAALVEPFEAFWDPVRQAYTDNLGEGAPLRSRADRRGDPGGSGGVAAEPPRSAARDRDLSARPLSEAANAAALVSGLVPADRHEVLVDLLTDRGRRVHATWLRPGADLADGFDDDAMYAGITYLFTGPPPPWWDPDRVVAAQPFFRYVVHDALVAAGRADLIPDVCRDWERLLERSDTTLSETWFGGTHCHGWSATPTRDLITRTLGIEPAGPGFGSARVAPRLGDLAWAEGAAPTPAGLLRVRAEPGRIEIDSPLALEVDPGDGEVRSLGAGQHVVT